MLTDTLPSVNTLMVLWLRTALNAKTGSSHLRESRRSEALCRVLLRQIAASPWCAEPIDRTLLIAHMKVQQALERICANDQLPQIVLSFCSPSPELYGFLA